jgi:hypothetical protein
MKILKASFMLGSFLLSAGAVAAEEAKPANTPAVTPVAATEIKPDRSCFQFPIKMDDKEVALFLGNPGGLLTDNPGGGLPMSNKVRSLAGSSAKAYDAIIGLVSKANSSQKAAIGAGLARVVTACRDSNAEFADMIQNGIAQFTDADLLAGYTGAASDTNVASVAGPGAGANTVGGGTTQDSNSQRSASNNYTNGYTPGQNQSRNNDSGGFTVGNAGGTVNDTVSRYRRNRG